MKPRTIAVLAFLTVAGCTGAAGAEERRPFRFRCGLTGALDLWIAPADFAFEGASGLSPGRREPAAAAAAGRKAAVQRLGPCVHWELSEQWHKPTLLGCAVVQGGAMFGTTEVVGLVNSDDKTPAGVMTLPYFAAGARVAFEIEIISDRLSARILSDYLGVPSRPLFTIDNRTLYQTAPFSMAIAGGLGVFF